MWRFNYSVDCVFSMAIVWDESLDRDSTRGLPVPLVLLCRGCSTLRRRKSGYDIQGVKFFPLVGSDNMMQPMPGHLLSPLFPNRSEDQIQESHDIVDIKAPQACLRPWLTTWI